MVTTRNNKYIGYNYKLKSIVTYSETHLIVDDQLPYSMPVVNIEVIHHFDVPFFGAKNQFCAYLTEIGNQYSEVYFNHCIFL